MNDHIRPNKRLGQHWLHDVAVLDSICDAADVRAGDSVLEVGPGLGTLTSRLLKRGVHVTAVEFDHHLAASLTTNLQELQEDSPLKSEVIGNLTVVEEDILRFNLQRLPEIYKVVANIPYYLTSNLVRVLCESANPFSTAALLVQKEVAERICASPGRMSLLSVSTQYYCDTKPGPHVPATLFTPPPKVDSQVVALRFREKPLFSDIDTKLYFRVVKAGFGQKRKTLENSLSAGLCISKQEARTLLAVAGIAPQARAQTLSLDEWAGLARTYQTK